MKERELNAAVKILLMLNAYCPYVKMGGTEEQLAWEKMKSKRRRRPLTGRGNWGKFIAEEIARKNLEKKVGRRGVC